MLRRTIRRLELHTTLGDSQSFRANFNHMPMMGVMHSPYKDAMKEYWASPIPWQPREYGEKPKPDDPVPLREAASTMVVAYNRHIDKGLVEAGEDNDYKVLMQFREAKGRFQKDQFVFPSAPVHLQDRDEDWAPLLHRLGVRETFHDIDLRLCAYRSLMAEANMLGIPPEGGGVAEVEGPPGPRNWYMMISAVPEMLRHLIDILDIPMEEALKQFRPFTRIQTPASEMFRYDNLAYLLPLQKVPCVRYTLSAVSEQLVWVSPKEAIARFETGVMEMPTPNVTFLHELDRVCPTFDKVEALQWNNTPDVILPELITDPETNMGTVLLPTDIHHSKNKKRAERRRRRLAAERGEPVPAEESATSAEAEEAEEGESKVDRFARFEFTKDIPWGVRSTFINRPIEADEEVDENFVRARDLTATEAEVLRLEYREENNRVLASKLKKVSNPDLKRLAERLPDEDAGEKVERIPRPEE